MAALAFVPGLGKPDRFVYAEDDYRAVPYLALEFRRPPEHLVASNMCRPTDTILTSGLTAREILALPGSIHVECGIVAALIMALLHPERLDEPVLPAFPRRACDESAGDIVYVEPASGIVYATMCQLSSFAGHWLVRAGAAGLWAGMSESRGVLVMTLRSWQAHMRQCIVRDISGCGDAELAALARKMAANGELNRWRCT